MTMQITDEMLTRRTIPGGDDAFVMLRDLLVAEVLAPHGGARSWTLQGFGMLRTYLGPSLRLHVWDPRYRVPDVTEIHDHPWHFTSLVVSGRMRNVRYQALPGLVGETEPTHVVGRIMCGARPTQDDVVTGSARLVVLDEETYGPGRSYSMRADELHASYPDAGTITLCRRVSAEGRSPDHASVCWPVGGSRVSAEPRAASPEEVQDILSLALGALSPGREGSDAR